jgi:WD40 repeat protein
MDPLQNLVAYYLAVNYPTVLKPFIEAANIPSPDVTAPPNPDLRTLVSDWRSRQLMEDLQSVTLEEPSRISNGSWKGWITKEMVQVEMPDAVHLNGVRRTLAGVTATNLLTVKTAMIPKRVFDLGSASCVWPVVDAITDSTSYRAAYTQSIITTSVDKTLKIIDYATGDVDRILEPHKAAILSFAVHPIHPRYLLTGSMDGT